MQQSLIQLVVAWTLVGAVIFTVVVTCASLVGLIRFADASQQKKMFYVLLVQLVGVSVAYFGHVLNFSTTVAANDAVKLSTYDYWNSFHQEGVVGIVKPSQFPDEYRYLADGVEGSIKYYANLNVYVETNKRLGNFPSYHYYFRPIKADDGYVYVYDDTRSFALKLPLKSGKSFFSGNGGNGPFTDWQDLIAL